MSALLLIAAMSQAAEPSTTTPADPLAPLPEMQAPASGTVEPAPQIAAPPPPSPPPPPIFVPVPRDWRSLFSALRSGQWASVEAGLASLGPSPLAEVARAELYLARGSPAVGADRFSALLAAAPELPQAEQLYRLAQARGAIAPPAPSLQYRLVPLGEAPRRQRARAVQGDAAADELRLLLDPLIKADAAPQAELLLAERAMFLTPEARAEAAQRIAWNYYTLGRDPDVRRVAEWARAMGAGEWGAQVAWIGGLASWRLGDYPAAAVAFRQVAGSTRDGELANAGLYWAARSEMAARRPHAVSPLLQAAARSPESFYGLLARRTLGLSASLPPMPASDAAAAAEALPNVRRAEALVAIGERGLAEQMLRHQARLSPPSQHRGLIEVARKLDLAGAQYWLAHNGPRGARVPASARYPMPRWSPAYGWRIDRSLAFAHALQESGFRTSVVSPAGAVGVMQVLPGTAGDIARARGHALASLTDPAHNIEYGQSFIERMRDGGATGGRLPKVIAAYNAGPLPVARWNHIYDRGDPLLWIESIPYWETRYYVPAVLRNLWVYQGLSNSPTPTLTALAQYQWPAFPRAAPQVASTATNAGASGH